MTLADLLVKHLKVDMGHLKSLSLGVSVSLLNFSLTCAILLFGVSLH